MRKFDWDALQAFLAIARAGRLTIAARLPGPGEPVERLQRNGILIDGEGVVAGGPPKILLQLLS